MRLVVIAAALGCFAAEASAEDSAQCRILDLSFAPATSADPKNFALPQIVAWLEDVAGNYVATVYITHATGTYGIGNRPGRFDFNSAPLWPYGRRITTFPVWSHKQPLRWPELVFQDGSDSQLSHAASQSSIDTYFCRPLGPSEMDAVTCPSAAPKTDKGRFGRMAASRYPPRNDLVVRSEDTSDAHMFEALNPFDAVSRPTPRFGVDAAASFALDPEVPPGDYVLWVEVAKELDMNATYNETVYPAPIVPFGNYGLPYRGQPSVVYRVPFTLDDATSEAMTADYAGYGDPEGNDGRIRAPDATIATEPGTGGGRLALLSSGGETYRVRVVARREDDRIPPAAPRDVNVADVTGTTVRIELIAPGDDGVIGPVQGYEIRYRTGAPITEANFDSSPIATPRVELVGPGELQTLVIDGLLPLTDYTVGIRAFDDCRNVGPLVVVPVTTTERLGGEVDACFIATAAYGSVMANDVARLRQLRDDVLRKTALGELFVETYYTFGPALAHVVGESEVLRETARAALSRL
jgi:hypothetical protein